MVGWLVNPAWRTACVEDICLEKKRGVCIIYKNTCDCYGGGGAMKLLNVHLTVVVLNFWGQGWSHSETHAFVNSSLSIMCFIMIIRCLVCRYYSCTLTLFFHSRVYDPDTLLQVQCNVGHTDLIRCIAHIPEMKQVLSALVHFIYFKQIHGQEK